MFTSDLIKNDVIMQDLECKYRRASELWHYRPLKGKRSRVFVAFLTGLIAFLRR